MKRLTAIFLCLVLILSACASNQPQETTSGTDGTSAPPTTDSTEIATTSPQVTFEAPFIALAMPVSVVETKADDGTLLYTHSTQAFSLILPEPDAAQIIMSDFADRTDSGSNAARLVHEAATKDYNGQNDWVPYVYSKQYSPARLDQSILSMYGTEQIFDGSAGSATVNLSVTYDLLTGSVLEEISQILTSDYSADALCQLIYAELSQLADEGVLYADYEYIISDLFATNTPVKNWYFNEVGLCFYFMPYEIAPHSVGTIITEIPYASLNGLLQDRYFPAETVDMYGAPVLEVYSDGNSYTQIAELILSEDAEHYVLHADGALFDVKIGYTVGDISSGKPESSIFAAASIGTGDAVMLHCTNDALTQLVITYRANGEYHTSALTDIIHK